MKKNSEELIVIQKRIFFLIILSVGIIGITVGYIVGYVTLPTKEVYIQKTPESEKTVLPSNLETQVVKKQDDMAQQSQQKSYEKESESKENIKIIKEAEASEKDDVGDTKELTKNYRSVKHASKKTIYKKAIYTVQLGAFNEIENAEGLVKKLKEEGINAQIVKENLYKIRTGSYKRFAEAQKVSEILKSKGFDNFVVKITKSSKGG